MIIAITGPSGSGKTTIAKMLACKHSMSHLCQDDFWFDGATKYYFGQASDAQRIYELAVGYDGKKLAGLARELEEVWSNNVIIEGIHAMTYPEVRKIVTHQFYLNVPWDISVQRRLARHRENQQISSKSWMDLGERFNELNVGFQRDLKNTTVLDGTKPTEELLDIISKKTVDLSTG